MNNEDDNPFRIAVDSVQGYNQSMIGGLGKPIGRRRKSIDTLFSNRGQKEYENFTKKVPVKTEEDEIPNALPRNLTTKQASSTDNNRIFLMLQSLARNLINKNSGDPNVQFHGRSFLLGIIVSNLTFLFKPFLIDLMNHLLRFLGGLLQISIILGVVAGVVLYLHYSVSNNNNSFKTAQNTNTREKKKEKKLLANVSVDGDYIPVMTTNTDKFDEFDNFFNNKPRDNPKFKAKTTTKQHKQHHYQEKHGEENNRIKLSEDVIPKRLIMHDTNEDQVTLNIHDKKKINILPEELALLKKLAASKYRKEIHNHHNHSQQQQEVKYSGTPIDIESPKSSQMPMRIDRASYNSPFPNDNRNNKKFTNSDYYQVVEDSTKIPEETEHSNRVEKYDQNNLKSHHLSDLVNSKDDENFGQLNSSGHTRGDETGNIASRTMQKGPLKNPAMKSNYKDEHGNSKNIANKPESISLLKTPMNSEFSFSGTPQSNIIMSDTNNSSVLNDKQYASLQRATLKGTHNNNNFDTLTIGTMSVIGDERESMIDNASIFRSNVRASEDDDDMISMLSGSNSNNRPGGTQTNSIGRMNSVSTAKTIESTVNSTVSNQEYTKFVNKVK